MFSRQTRKTIYVQVNLFIVISIQESISKFRWLVVVEGVNSILLVWEFLEFCGQQQQQDEEIPFHCLADSKKTLRNEW